MYDSKSLDVSFFVVAALTLSAMHLAYKWATLSVARSRFKRANNCQPVSRYPLKDPFFGYDYWKALNRAAESNTLLHWIREQYRLHGNTYYARLHTTDVISTCEPENLRVMHSTNFKDFAVDSRRKLAFLPLLGAHSVLLANGATWEHKRAMLKPSFSRDQYTNLPLFETHVGHLIQALKRADARAGHIDLADFFLCLTVDITSELMYGTSIGLLVSENRDLVHDMTTAAEGGHSRWLLVFLAKIIGNPVFNDSVNRVRKYMRRFVDEAISYGEYSNSKIPSSKQQQKELKGKELDEESNRIIYLKQLAGVTSNRVALMDELTTILFAGRDTTAALLTNLFFILSQRPDVYAKLRAEVGGLNGQRPTFKELKGLTYLQNCLSEALRLYPVIPINTRMAVVDTTLPSGGGPTGKSPIFVPAGTNIAFHVTALHRRKDLWGEDVDEFRPERWEKIKGQGAWMYQPFGGGPRNCPGQHLSLTEAAYTTMRLVEEFATMESRDEEPWTERIALTCTNANGARVVLTEA